MTDSGMLTVIMTSALYKIGIAILAVLAVLLLLRVFDKLAQRPFTQTLEIIHEDPIATACYYGARIVAVSLLVGGLLS